MTAKFITVFNQKGGCAKTMTAMQIAGTLGLHGLKVFVADVDPQNTSALWSLSADSDNPFPAEVLSLAALQEGFVSKLLPIAENYDVVIIDCPPALGSNVPWAALSIADLALIPVIPVMDNVWASKAAEDLIIRSRQAREANGVANELKAAYLLSQVRRGKVFSHCLRILRDSAKIPILKSSISMRNAFPESQVYGCCVQSFGASAASDEVEAVVGEVAELLGIKLKKSKGRK